MGKIDCPGLICSHLIERGGLFVAQPGLKLGSLAEEVGAALKAGGLLRHPVPSRKDLGSERCLRELMGWLACAQATWPGHLLMAMRP